MKQTSPYRHATAPDPSLTASYGREERFSSTGAEQDNLHVTDKTLAALR